jgi:hypothetical protein
MAPVVRIDDEVMAELKKRAITLGLVFEPPNSTLRSVLGLDSQANLRPEAAVPATEVEPQAPAQRGERVPKGKGGQDMLSFIRTANERYANNQTDREGYIAEVWAGIRHSAEKSGKTRHVVEEATKAFLELYEESGHSPVTPKAIAKRANLGQTSSLLWPWVQRNAGVIRMGTDKSGRRYYSIPDDNDYVHLSRVVLHQTGS